MSAATELDALLSQAIAAHQAGRFKDAEALYQAVLAANPETPDAAHNLGILAAQAGQLAAALPYFRRAVAANPGHPQYHLSLIQALLAGGQPALARQALADAQGRGCGGKAFDDFARRLAPATPASPVGATGTAIVQALMAQGRYEEMAVAAGTLTARQPRDGYAWHLLGTAHLLLGRLAEAVDALRRAVALAPGLAEAHGNLGLALLESGQPNEAAAAQRRSFALKPSPETLNNLALALLDLGRPADALAELNRALGLQPMLPQSHNNLGLTQQALGNAVAAEASFRAALGYAPQFPEAHCNLGAALAARQRFGEALTALRQAVKLRPDYVDAWFYQGNVLALLGRNGEAAEAYCRAVEHRSGHAEAWIGLGKAYLSDANARDAIPALRNAVQLAPDSFEARVSLGQALTEERFQGHEAIEHLLRAEALQPASLAVQLCLGASQEIIGHHDESIERFRRALDIAPDSPAVMSGLLFAVNYHPDRREDEIYAAYKDYDDRFGTPHRQKWRGHGNDRAWTRRLKVGYVSPDYNAHPVARFLEPLLAAHDREAVAVYAYAESRRVDETTERYRRHVDSWLPTQGMSDDALAERIRGDAIDILVDLAGHTSGNRLGVFARKPAPVSVTWLGSGYTTGLKAIDYLLTDVSSVPVGTEAMYAEAPWRLAESGFVYRPAEGMGMVSVLPALDNGYVTFGTLTRAVRLNHRLLRVWAEILRRVPGSRLVIDSRNFLDQALCGEIGAQFAERGIDPQRLELGFHTPPWDVLRGMDIGLDCFPHNSGTTLFESLYMGVPYVTLAGETSPRRLGGSILTGVGHGEWIAATEAEYIEKAVALAADLPKLAAIRANLRAKMTASPLMDEAGFARKVEAAYREMFKRWVEREGELER